jgi:hypothetical protein
MRSILIVALIACIAGVGGAPVRIAQAAAAPRAGPARPSERLHTGTLVIVIPTADGAVVASDSRGSLSDGSFEDAEQKIVRSAGLPVAAFATGTTRVTLSDRRSRRVRVDYDVFAVLRRELGRLDHVPQTDDFRRIAEAVAQAVRGSRVAANGQLRNRHIVVGLVTFAPAEGKTSTHVARLDLDASGKLTVDYVPVAESAGGSARRLGVYGDGDYALAHVLRGAGRARLSRDTLRFLNVRTTVGEIRSPAAYAAAKDIIEAVGRRMADDRPARATVGGPTRGVLVGPSGTRVLGDAAAN